MGLVAVDVGTTSARAGVFSLTGDLLGRGERPVAVLRAGPDRGEHSADDIWAAVCAAVREALAASGLAPDAISGIGFDATCSLVLRDGEGQALALSQEDGLVFDTIAWFDHRAREETLLANRVGHETLADAGGPLHPEMELPKLIWLKRNRPELWARAGAILDLADFLTFRATGSLARSQSTLAGKWSLPAHRDEGWPEGLLADLGLGDLAERAGLSGRPVPVGAAVGVLTGEAAEALGLCPGCPVAAGMVDAHAGALALLGPLADEPEALARHAGLITGTSSAVMVMGGEPVPVAGVWGPYFGTVLTGFWMSEGGQSASGALLDHIVANHPEGRQSGRDIHQRIAARIVQMQANAVGDIAPGLHLLPDVMGSRSPSPDPNARGVVVGLALDTGFDGLCRIYWRTAVALALGVRQILETFNRAGYRIDTLHVSGGHARSQLLIQLYADATGCVIEQAGAPDAMLIGGAMAAGCAAGVHGSLADAARAMQAHITVHRPDPVAQRRLESDYAIFTRMQAHRAEIARMARQQEV
ncbi:FGGY-family carbohydrate kinase [Pelagibacterium montanilacus]|uniref:FGGY-family carbohydrate kinase n=1 Tax=Pelagibacterium montanilacus TaxID=2185280 RepID=UPI000F8C7A5C|nr:FGGY-family carbohydrate kinase [Pelagibacterium montanilacus]